MNTRLSAALFILLLATTALPAQTPLGSGFKYQGRLVQAGSPANGPFSMAFDLFDVPTGGASLGQQTINPVMVVDGLFTVQLNGSDEFGLDAFNGDERWLEIRVGTTSLLPRQPITAAPYSHFALNADRLEGLGSEAFLQSVPNPLTLSGNSATPIIQANNNSDLSNTSAIRAVISNTSPGSSSTAVRGQNNGTGASGIGVWGSQDGYGFGVLGTSVSGLGVFGRATAETGNTYGVYGQSDSESGTGVFGKATALDGANYGVYGSATAGSGVVGSGYTGVVGISSASNSIGVWGQNTSLSGSAWAVYGESASINGVGVLGWATNAGGANRGVDGRSASATGFDFYASGAGMDYGSPSSIRWKHNVTNISNPLEKLSRLRGVYFDWDSEHGGRHDVGMIAEEVGGVLPEIVQFEENGIDANGMDYSKMTPLLVEAVNSLRAEKDLQIETLQQENNKLHARLGALEELFSQTMAAGGQR